MANERETALASLTDMVAADQRPTLTQEALGRILDRCAVLDPEGHLASEDDWVPTYDLNHAAALAYGLKAGRVAGDFSFSADGSSYAKADVMAHLLEMQAHYAAKCHGVLVVTGPLDSDLDLIARKVIP